MAKKYLNSLVNASLSIAALVAAGCFVAGCAEDTTAGVFTETESGQQASIDVNGDKLVVDGKRTYAMVNVQGIAVDENGNQLKNARVLLKRAHMDVDSVQESITDENGIYKFDQVIYKTTYIDDTTLVEYMNYTLQVMSSDNSVGSYEVLTFENSKRVTEGENVYLEAPEQTAHKTVSAELKTYGYKQGRNVCLDYSGICHEITADEAEAGTFIMENIPEGFYYNLCSVYTDEMGTESKCAFLDEILVTKPVVDTLSYALPAEAVSLLDSLEDKSVPNILVKIKSSADDPLMVGSDFSKPIAITDNDEYFWTGITLKGADTANYKLLEHNPSDVESSVLMAQREVKDKSLPNSLTNDGRNNIGVSFKVKANGADSEQELVILSTVDSASGKAVGYEVRQCEAGSKSVCVRVYSGLDSVATDTTVYGKTNLLDGEEHQFSLAVIKSHLTVAVDGKIIRDTDLKVSEGFGTYNAKDVMTIGSTSLDDFLLFSMDEDIRKKGETNWNRLKAWMIAHQTLSK